MTTAPGSPPATPLVTAAELLRLLDRGDDVPLLLDVRWTLSGAQREKYLAAHLPGAVFCDLDAELAGAPGNGGRHPLPDPAALTSAMRRLGVAPGRPVVAYDAGPSAAAARAWWVLRWAGQADVRVLDGGLAAWLAAGGPVEGGDVVPAPAPEAVARPGSMPVLTTQDVEDVVAGADRDPVLLDARAGERFRAEVEPVDPVAGHIPGAVSLPTSQVQHPDGRFLDAGTLRRVFARVRVPDGGSVGAYCGSGVTACVLVLGLERIGLTAALYPGSWSAWVSDPAHTVATGD